MNSDRALEWRASWPVAICGSVGLYVAVIYVYSFGVFIAPIQQEFGWSMTSITLGMMIVSIVAVIGNSFVGLLIDRLGAGRIAMTGVSIYALAISSLALTGPGIIGWWLRWLLIAISSLGICVPVWLVGVARRFDRSRGLAMAFGYAGSSLAAMSVPILTLRLIQGFGWRGAYLGLAAIAFVLGTGAAWYLLRCDLRHGCHGLGPRIAKAHSGEPGIKPVLASSHFWRLGCSSLAITMGVIGLTVHMVPLLVEKGLTRDNAALFAGLIGLAGFAGRITTGYLLDRFPAHFVGAVSYILPVLACIIFTGSKITQPGAIMATLLVGASLGAELDVMAYISARMFGLQRFGVVFGILTGVVSLGSGIGPVIVAMLHECLGTYSTVASLLIVPFVASALTIYTLGDGPKSVGSAIPIIDPPN